MKTIQSKLMIARLHMILRHRLIATIGEEQPLMFFYLTFLVGFFIFHQQHIIIIITNYVTHKLGRDRCSLLFLPLN